MASRSQIAIAHRSHEWPVTLEQLRLAFADTRHFAIHGPVPASFGDEGAANHLRLCAAHGEARRAVARLHGLDPDRVVFAQQSCEAIAAGAFHADVVAVANEHVLFAHEQAFADPAALYETLRRNLPKAEIIEVPASAVSLADAIATYQFNAQLVTLPEGGMALILPTEACDHAGVWSWLNTLIASNGPIRRLVPVEVRQSMANGGGPACLRLRVVAEPATVDPRFLVDGARLDLIEEVVRRTWPRSIDPGHLDRPSLWPAIRSARLALLNALGLGELV